MKIEFIKRGAETRLILIFAGWSTDSRYYIDCVADGWDTAVVSDYRDLSMPELPPQYTTIYVFAYSLGVFAASQCELKSSAKIAICGSELPVSDEYGIPASVFKATADGLDLISLKKFHRRMAGDRASISRIDPLLPISPDIDSLKSELYAIAAVQDKSETVSKWDKVYIANHDRIFPFDNLNRYWSQFPETEKIAVDSSHALDISKIVKDVIPDPMLIAAGFSIATATYKENASVQAEICCRIGELLKKNLEDKCSSVKSLLEIGVGTGMLTEVWRNVVSPTDVTYIDLLPMPNFGFAENEKYIETDAEEWLKRSSSKFDIILSASTIQWFADPIHFIDTVKIHLNPGGLAIISTFTKGNLHQLDEVRPSPVIYRSVDEYRQIPSVEIEAWERTLVFPSVRNLLMHLRLTGVSPRRKTSQIVKNEGMQSKKLASLSLCLTYNPLVLTIKN